MKVKATAVMAKTLQKYIKDYKITLQKYNERAYSMLVDYNTFDHEEDFDYKTSKFNVIKITYPDDYYACDRYLTTRTLTRLFNKSNGTFESFLQQIKNEIEV